MSAIKHGSEPVPPISHPTNSPRSISLVFSSHLFLPSAHIPWDFRTKILHAFYVSSIRATYPAHQNFPDFNILTVLSDLHKSRSFTLCIILSCLLISSLLDPNRFWSLCFQTFAIYSSFRVRDHVSNQTQLTQLLFYVILIVEGRPCQSSGG
jgi:hypothetical protein